MPQYHTDSPATASVYSCECTCEGACEGACEGGSERVREGGSDRVSERACQRAARQNLHHPVQAAAAKRYTPRADRSDANVREEGQAGRAYLE